MSVKWFTEFKNMQELIDFFLKDSVPSTEEELRERETIEKNATFLFSSIKNKKGYKIGIQHCVCMCGKDHDETVAIAPDMLEKKEWKKKDKLKTSCQECMQFSMLALQLYGQEKADKIIKIIWGAAA